MSRITFIGLEIMPARSRSLALVHLTRQPLVDTLRDANSVQGQGMNKWGLGLVRRDFGMTTEHG